MKMNKYHTGIQSLPLHRITVDVISFDLASEKKKFDEVKKKDNTELETDHKEAKKNIETE